MCNNLVFVKMQNDAYLGSYASGHEYLCRSILLLPDGTVDVLNVRVTRIRFDAYCQLVTVHFWVSLINKKIEITQ